MSQCAPSFTTHPAQLPPATTILHPASAPLHPPPRYPPTPPQSSSRLQKLSIARFICVSHYRKWNVVPAKHINSVVGEISLLLYGTLTLSHLNLWWRWEPSSGASGLGDGGSCGGEGEEPRVAATVWEFQASEYLLNFCYVNFAQSHAFGKLHLFGSAN